MVEDCEPYTAREHNANNRCRRSPRCVAERSPGCHLS
jgi:hypothetical protein